MSLSTPHPMLSCARSPFEVRKAVVVARMLSGRYRTDQLARHWSSTNQAGLCRLPGCSGEALGTLEHILLYCPALTSARAGIVDLWKNFMVPREHLFPIISNLTSNEESHMQLLMDPSSIPTIILANLSHPDFLSSCFFLSKTWAYAIHLRRTKIMTIWNLT